MAEQTAQFSGTVAMMMVVEAVEEEDGEAAAWSRRQRRSGMGWFLDTAMVWRQSGWQQRGLGGVEEDAGNFGSLTASKSKSSS
jgi:hypothetical protein